MFNNMKEKEVRVDKIPVSQSLDFLKFGFDNYGKLSNSDKSFNIKNIYYSQQTTAVIEFKTKKKTPMDIKIDLGEIISFIGSFYLSDDENSSNYEVPLLFAAIAFNSNDDKLIYALSTHAAAKCIMNGDPIGWIKSTIFEDQTFEALLTQAKVKISRIEQALRKVIYNQFQTHNKWNKLLSTTVLKDAIKIMRKKHGVESLLDEELLDYTYIPNLKDIITKNWDIFEDIYSDKDSFERDMQSLNRVRREESHNRKLTEKKLTELAEIYNTLMESISIVFPDLIPDYLLEHWRISLHKIIQKYSDSIPNLEEKYRSNIKVTLTAMVMQHNALKEAILDLKNFEAPPSRIALHSTLKNIFISMETEMDCMITCGKDGKLEKMTQSFKRLNSLYEDLNSFQTDYLLSES
jgi:hypothetical protein